MGLMAREGPFTISPNINCSKVKQNCVLNERGKFGGKIFIHYTDIVIFVLGYLNLNHPVYETTTMRLKSFTTSDIVVGILLKACTGCDKIEEQLKNNNKTS